MDWMSLTTLTGGAAFTVERVRFADTRIAIEGRFDLPPLARLAVEDQVFVAAFVRCHGSIKQMETLFGVSYPTIKNRLNRIGECLPFAEVTPSPAAPVAASELLSQLERGEITARDAIARLRGEHDDHD